MDGRRHLKPSMLQLLCAELMLYDSSLLELNYRGKAVNMHLFERSVEIRKSKQGREYYPALQMVLAMKEHRGGLLNSHLWFFTAFCKQLQPMYVLSLECGVETRPGAISRMVQVMDRNDQVAAVSGEVAVKELRLWNVWHAVQHFELKLWDTLEKRNIHFFFLITTNLQIKTKL